MNQEIKTKWAEALRSGMYKQGTGCLREGDAFCCLGVLCDMHLIETNTGDWDGAYYLDEPGLLPKEVIAWADLKANDPIVIDPFTGHARSLSGLNDNLIPFKEIADMIESCL